MSEKPADEAKEEPAEEKEKPTKSKKKPTEAKEKSAKAKEKATKSKKEPTEAKEKATKSKEEPAEAKEEPVEPKEKPIEAKGKPLEKMTVKDLREMAKEMPEITGVHGMKKEELIVAIRDARGIKAAPVKKADATIAALKKKIRALKVERQAALETKNRKMATIYKRRISRLKKKTRRAAA